MIDHLNIIMDITHLPINPQPRLEDGQVTHYWSKTGTLWFNGAKVEFRTFDKPIHPGRLNHRLQLIWNPAKYTQGHNVFGTRDLGLILTTVADILGSVGINPTPGELARVIRGDFEVRRIDLNCPIRFASYAQAETWIQAMATLALQRGRRCPYENFTVYFGAKGSDYKVSMLYNKHRQMLEALKKEQAHRRHWLLSEAQGMVRFETSFRRRWLNTRGLDRGFQWLDPGPLRERIVREFEALTLPASVSLLPHVVESLSRAPGLVHAHWQSAGPTVVEALWSPAALARHRVEIMAHDIDLRSPAGSDRPLVLLRDLIDFDATIPTWAIGTPLYFDGRVRAPDDAGVA